MTFLDLFAGVGGFRRGMELAGHKCVGFCENDKYAVMSYTAMHLITEEQRQYLETLDLRARQKEILKDEYRNGEWYADDIRSVDARGIPKADCWCFGFSCQDISIAGNHLGFAGARSSLFFATTRLVRDLEEEDRPGLLFIENVRNLLGINKGFDFARLLIELDEIGYDAEWQVLNSKDFGVPQNRERVFIIGHLRGKGGPEVFPIEADIGQDRDDKESIFCDLTYEGGLNFSDNAHCLQSRYQKIAGYHKRENSGVAVPITFCDLEQSDRGLKPTENARALQARYNHGFNSRQCDKSGALVKVNGDMEVYAIWSEEHQSYIAIRKLTPKECFRLQGWTDEYFNRAQLVNSDTQLYKQAGNGVTVNVIKAIAERIENGKI